MVAVRWYLRFGLSCRDVEELLAERGVDVDHVGVYRWVQRFTPSLVEAARPCRPRVADRWCVDETTSRWRARGASCTRPSTSSAGWSTCWSRHPEMPLPPGVFLPRPERRPGLRRLRW
jgi:hypothetical protein